MSRIPAMHEAATRPQPASTAFAARRAQWDFDAIGQWTDAATSEKHIAWVRALCSRCEPHLLGSTYVNHLSADDRPEIVRASYGENYPRLRKVKAMYDPTFATLVLASATGNLQRTGATQT